MTRPVEETDVAVVGGGPAGLAAALALRAAGVSAVTVIERERAVGGIPRHSHHTGYGVRDLHRVMSGPEYARLYERRVRAAGAEVRTGTMVTGWSEDGGLELTGPTGPRVLRASAVLLATGARERPRSARLVPGDRGQGVYTTGLLQQAVYAHGQSIGTRALIVGAEHVSFSAMMTLRHAGVPVAALVTDAARHESYAAFDLGARVLFRVPVLTRTRVAELRGRPRLSEVVLERDGHRTSVACDTIVFTGDWIPDHELAWARGAELTPVTRGPAVDATGATTVPWVFAAGNLCHPVETADIAALGGRHTGEAVARLLRNHRRSGPHTDVRAETGEASALPRDRGRDEACTDARIEAGEASAPPWDRGRADAEVPIEVGEAFAWAYPERLRSTVDLPARGRLYLRSRVSATLPRIVVTQGGRVLGRLRVPRLVAGRTATLGCSWLARVDLDGPPVRVEIG